MLMILAGAVSKRRNALGHSQEWLGTHIDGDQGYVSRIESGQMNATLETIGAIASPLRRQGFLCPFLPMTLPRTQSPDRRCRCPTLRSGKTRFTPPLIPPLVQT